MCITPKVAVLNDSTLVCSLYKAPLCQANAGLSLEGHLEKPVGVLEFDIEILKWGGCCKGNSVTSSGKLL